VEVRCARAIQDRPSWLPCEGPPQLSIQPRRWAIQLKQLIRLLRAIRETQTYKELLAEHGYVNMYMVNDYFIIPWTAGLGSSMALLLNPNGLAAQAMASHAWIEDNEELEDALLRFQADQNLPDELAIWVCTMANYQPKKSDSVDDVGPTISEQLALDPFGEVIRSEDVKTGGLVAVHTTAGDLYTRLWCPYEMNEAALIPGMTVHGAASGKYLEAFRKSFQFYRDYLNDGSGKRSEKASAMLEELLEQKLKVDTNTAQCGSKHDEKLIRANIEAMGGGVGSDGYKLLNTKIYMMRKTMMDGFMGDGPAVKRALPAPQLAGSFMEQVEQIVTQKTVELQQDLSSMVGHKIAELEQENAELQQENAQQERKNAELEQKNAELERKMQELQLGYAFQIIVASF